MDFYTATERHLKKSDTTADKKQPYEPDAFTYTAMVYNTSKNSLYNVYLIVNFPATW